MRASNKSIGSRLVFVIGILSLLAISASVVPMAKAASTVVATISMGSHPASILHATSTTVICDPSTVVVNQTTSCTATVIDTATGSTTPTGTAWIRTDHVLYAPRDTCALAGTGGSAACSVEIMPTTAGSVSVSASYGGDAAHQVSSGSTIVTVAPVQQAPSKPSVDYTLYAGLGAGVLVVLLGVFLLVRRRRVTPKSN